MKTKEILELKKGSQINHKRYGLAEVEKVVISFGELFGVIIVPKTKTGKSLLAWDSAVTGTSFLEDSPRQIQQTGA